MKIKPRSRLLFIGDSITDCGRNRPVGEGETPELLGNGYVSLIDAALTAAYPDYAIYILNMGVSGDTVRDLKSRWRTDVLNLQPDWLSIMIGINDVWRCFNGFQLAGQGITLEEYVHTLDELIGQIHPELSGMILMTPYYLETQQNEPIRSMMDQFGSAVRDLARKYDALLVDTQAAFDQVLQSLHPYQLAMDRVHVNLTGHSVLARAWLRCVGYQFERPEWRKDKTAGG